MRENDESRITMPTSRRDFLRRVGATALGMSVGRMVLHADVGSESEELRKRLALDPLRPQYHLMPAANWMNDPNGPIYFGGRYHMFHQYNPASSVWGDMHWAHATSKDMLHWRHEPVAIAPTSGGWDRDGVFSGSIVINEGEATAIYTGVLPPQSSEQATLRDGIHESREVQCLAIAQDDGLRRWKKLDEPIISSPPTGMQVTGFRDPVVWREGEEWLLALGSGLRDGGGAILLYRSRDLRRWEYLHPLMMGARNPTKSENPVDNGNMWECPDFFPLGGKHVLLLSTMGKVSWKVGNYQERRFTPEKEGVVDWGAFYAAKSMLDKTGRRILWGWIPETRAEAEYRAAGWAGAMSLPRILSVNAHGELEMQVIPEIATLRGSHVRIAGSSDGNKLEFVRIRDRAAQVSIDCRLKEKSDFLLRLENDGDKNFLDLKLAATPSGHELRVHPQAIPLTHNGAGDVQLRIFIDGSVAEIFANSTVAITKRIYDGTKGPLRVRADGQFSSLDIWQMRAISPDRLTT